MSQFKIFRSTDTSAPTLSGTAGDLTNLLDKILVGTAGIAYGTKAAAGWTIAFTGTNKRAYRQGGGRQRYYRVLDDATTTVVTAKEGLIRGFTAMTDVDTGTGPFPTDAQSALTQHALVIRKSSAASGTARAWVALADNRTCYLLVLTADTSNVYVGTMFGDVYNFSDADLATAALIAGATEDLGSEAQTTRFAIGQGGGPYVGSWTAMAGHVYESGYTGFGGPAGMTKFASLLATSAGTGNKALNGGITFPNAADGSLILSRIYHVDTTGGAAITVRGWLRGMWACGHPASSFADGDTVSGTGALSGRSFMAVKSFTGAGDAVGPVLFFETSNTVE